MKTLRVLKLIAASLILIPVAAVAFAQQKPAPGLIDLADVLTPQELALEFGINENNPSNLLWKSSFENPRLLMIVNKAERGTAPGAQTLEVYVDGVLSVRVKVSTGKEIPITTTSGKISSRRTSAGIFRIQARSKNHVSKVWTGASMPFAQFFNGGIAIHATTQPHYKMLGQRDSGGCVRLRYEVAEMMWNLVNNFGVSETQIIVYDGTKTAHPMGEVTQVPLMTDKDFEGKKAKSRKTVEPEVVPEIAKDVVPEVYSDDENPSENQNEYKSENRGDSYNQNPDGYAAEPVRPNPTTDLNKKQLEKFREPIY